MAYRANWAADPSAADMRRELVERAHEMGDTEFRVKTARLRQAGGFWPRSLHDWGTEGRTLMAAVEAARYGRSTA